MTATPALSVKLTYPKDSHPLDTPGDTWEYETTRAAGETSQYPRDKDLYAQAKETAEKRTEAGHRKPEVFIPIYKNLYAAKYGQVSHHSTTHLRWFSQ